VREVDLNTVTEVVGSPDVRAWQPGDAWLAGGTSLFSQPQPGVRRLLDLAALDWPPLTLSDEGLSIAATCTVAELFAARLPISGLVRQCCRAFVASFKIWNVATVGGNLCTALPAGPMIALTAALDGVCVLHSPGGGTRRLPVTEFVIGDGRTALRPGELLRSIELPAAALRARTAFRQGSLHTLGRSAALVIGRADADTEAEADADADTDADADADADGSVVLTITASTPRPVQLRVANGEALLPPVPEEGFLDDVHGGAAWRRHLTTRFAAAILDELR
jgi:CO/xanthine dehydrogenase FAD-binding subunit